MVCPVWARSSGRCHSSWQARSDSSQLLNVNQVLYASRLQSCSNGARVLGRYKPLCRIRPFTALVDQVMATGNAQMELDRLLGDQAPPTGQGDVYHGSAGTGPAIILIGVMPLCLE
jgi:hypothetical protein